MVLKGLDNQLEIATLDSLGKAIYDKFVFSLMVQDELYFSFMLADLLPSGLKYLYF
jgi:hypothetical protein